MCKTRLFCSPKQYLLKKRLWQNYSTSSSQQAIATFMLACNSATTADSKTSEATEAKESSGFDLVAAKSTIESQNAKLIETFKRVTPAE